MKSGTLPQFNIVVENCTSCNGLFLDKGELSSVIRNKTVPVPKQRLKTRYKDLNDKSIRRELPDFFLEILDNDETVLWAEKPHFFGYLLTYLIGVIPIVLGAFFAIFSVALKHDKNSIPLFELNLYYTKYIVIFLIVVGSFIYWGYSNVIYALTSKRVIISTGMMGIDFSSIDYSKVTDLSLSVGPVDKILGTGSIYIYTASSDESFSAIATPYSVYKKIKKLTYRK